MLNLLALFLVLPIALAQLFYPPAGATWKVGEQAQCTVGKGVAGETVNIFFNNDRTEAVAGGPIDDGQKTFKFIVPLRALSPQYGTTDFLVVHRIHKNLTSVDNVPLHIVW